MAAKTARKKNSSAGKKPGKTWKPPMSSQMVAARTGRGWSEWLSIIDRENGRTIGHTAIAELLYTKYRVPGWWSQMVTVGYEQARGLRDVHQKPEGFEIGVSRTIDAGMSQVFDAWLDARTRARWLPGNPLTVHKATRNKSLRATWSDGSKSISVGFLRKGAAKTQVALAHGKLGSAAAAKKMKAFWSKRLDALKNLAEKMA